MNPTPTARPTSRRLLGSVALATLLLSLHGAQPAFADPFSEDWHRPTPWTYAAGVETPHTDRSSHVYYFALPTQRVEPNHHRQVGVRLLARGQGRATAAIGPNTQEDPRRSVPLVLSTVQCTAGAGWTERSASGRFPGLRPSLVVAIDAGITNWSVMIDDRMVADTPRVPHRPTGSSPRPRISGSALGNFPDLGPLSPSTPSGTTPSDPTHYPAVPGGQSASPWPGSGLSGAIPPGHEPVYFQLDWHGGRMTIESTITTSFNGNVTLDVLDPTAPADSPTSIFTSSNIYTSPDGQRHTSPVHTDTHDLAAGHYLLRVTRESASTADPTYTLNLH